MENQTNVESSEVGKKALHPETRNKRLILVIMIVVLLVLIGTFQYVSIFPVAIGAFFLLSLIRGDSESDEDPKWFSWSYIRKIILAFGTIILIGYATILYAWIGVLLSIPLTLLLTLFLIFITAAGIYYYRHLTVKGRASDIGKIAQLRFSQFKKKPVSDSTSR